VPVAPITTPAALPVPPAAAPAAAEPTESAAARALAGLDETGQRRLALVLQQVTDDLLSERPGNAADTLERAAREGTLAPLSSELYRAATLAAEGSREHGLLLQSLTDDIGLSVTLSTRTGTLRLKLLRLEGDTLVGVKLHPLGDTPMGQVRLEVQQLTLVEELSRLRRFAGKPVGDFVLTLVLLREGRVAAAQEPLARLPLLLQLALRPRAQTTPSPTPPADPAARP
jgi:hypothetical protein